MFLNDEAARDQTGEGSADLLVIESGDASDVVRRRIAKDHGGDNTQSSRFGKKPENAAGVLKAHRLDYIHRAELRRRFDENRPVPKREGR
jgi:hypothetical protein